MFSSYNGFSAINRPKPNLERSIELYPLSVIISIIARPTAGACCIPDINKYELIKLYELH